MPSPISMQRGGELFTKTNYYKICQNTQPFVCLWFFWFKKNKKYLAMSLIVFEIISTFYCNASITISSFRKYFNYGACSFTVQAKLIRLQNIQP